MTNEDKQLRIKDLCGRLPFGVVCRYKEQNIVLKPAYLDFNGLKPYLRPMSSMTEDERKEFRVFREDIDGYVYSINVVIVIDWLNEHYFDYRGLIERGLALEAPEGMYQ